MSYTDIIQRVVNSAFFSRLSLGMILFSSILIGVETVDSLMAQYGEVLKMMDRVILGWFTIEIISRMAAYGRKTQLFFKCPWNVFDFLIVAVTLLPAASPALAVFRLFRIFRVLRLFSAIPDLQILVGALLKTLPSMGYVGILLFLVVYVYGVLGVHLFEQTDPVHFGDLGLSLLSLFQIITLEGWAEIFRPQFQKHGWGAVLFFLSFIFIGTMILLNLLIGVVLRSMEQVQSENAKHAFKDKKSRERALDEIISSSETLLEKIRLYKDGKAEEAVTIKGSDPGGAGQPSKM